jgi:glycerophosphoryl diester phosphodiesterase
VKPLVIAHRGGAAGTLDENSLEAFEHGIGAGADMLEFDVRITRERELVAFHDPGVNGTPLSALTREQVAAITGAKPPLLGEVLELARGRVGLDVELKEDGYVERVLDLLLKQFEPEELIVSSFLDSAVAAVKRRSPSLPTALLLGIEHPRHTLRTRASELFPVARARRCRADYVAPFFKFTRLGVLNRVSAAGLPALVWTVNDDRSLEQLLADDRVAGVITDVPDRALALRARAA